MVEDEQRSRGKSGESKCGDRNCIKKGMYWWHDVSCGKMTMPNINNWNRVDRKIYLKQE